MLKDKEIDTPEIFFLRGYQKSGVSWLEDILNLHPDINCQGPFHLEILMRGLKNFESNNNCITIDGNPGFSRYLRHSFRQFLLNQIIRFCGTEHKLIGDSTPVALGTLLIPDTKYIVISRDGRDVIVDHISYLIKTGAQNIKNIKGFEQIPSLHKKIALYQKDRSYFI